MYARHISLMCSCRHRITAHRQGPSIYTGQLYSDATKTAKQVQIRIATAEMRDADVYSSGIEGTERSKVSGAWPAKLTGKDRLDRVLAALSDLSNLDRNGVVKSGTQSAKCYIVFISAGKPGLMPGKVFMCPDAVNAYLNTKDAKKIPHGCGIAPRDASNAIKHFRGKHGWVRQAVSWSAVLTLRNYVVRELMISDGKDATSSRKNVTPPATQSPMATGQHASPSSASLRAPMTQPSGSKAAAISGPSLGRGHTPALDHSSPPWRQLYITAARDAASFAHSRSLEQHAAANPRDKRRLSLTPPTNNKQAKPSSPLLQPRSIGRKTNAGPSNKTKSKSPSAPISSGSMLPAQVRRSPPAGVSR